MSNADLINGPVWNGQTFNGPVICPPEPAAEHKILFNQTSIELFWSTVDTATHYQIQVSLFHDFRTTIVDEIVTESDHSFTDSATNDEKRYWRTRPSMDGGSSFMEPFSEIASYWLDSAAVAEIEISKNVWAITDPEASDIVYLFPLFPIYTIVDQNLFRIQERNRLGELLSELLTVKGTISLNFSGGQYIGHQQFHELVRFHNIIKVVYLMAFKDGERARPLPHIWKVEFVEDPAFTMMAAGRQDLLQGQISFTEV